MKPVMQTDYAINVTYGWEMKVNFAFVLQRKNLE